MATTKNEGETVVATTKELTFQLEKETKNTFRLQELNEDGDIASADEWLIGNLYVQKSFFGGKTPKNLKVTLEAI